MGDFINKLALTLFFLIFLLPITAFAQALDVTVGTDALVYSPGDNVTVSGYVYNRGSPVSGATVTISIDGSSIGSYQTDLTGRYQSNATPVGSAGIHTIVAVAQTSSSVGSAYGSYKVEEKKDILFTQTNSLILLVKMLV